MHHLPGCAGTPFAVGYVSQYGGYRNEVGSTTITGTDSNNHTASITIQVTQ